MAVEPHGGSLHEIEVVGPYEYQLILWLLVDSDIGKSTLYLATIKTISNTIPTSV